MTLKIVETHDKRYSKHLCVECGNNFDHSKFWLVKDNKYLGIFHQECANKITKESSLSIDFKIKTWNDRMNKQHLSDDKLFTLLEEYENEIEILKKKNNELINENKYLRELYK
jgi:hypothetical protein